MTRVGVIGVGALGRHHARLYGACEGAELVGIFDVSKEQAAKIAAEFGGSAYDSIEALCADVDAVSVAVPTNLHHAVVSQVLELGCHVLVEKPLAASTEEANDLVRQAEAAGKIMHVGHVERFNPVITWLRERIDRPRFIEAHRLAPYPPPRPGLPPRGTEVGVVLDLMIHDIDVILHLVNAPVTEVSAVGIPVLSQTEDIANARLTFANGCVANITASRVSTELMRKIRVFQENAYLSLDYQDRDGYVVRLGPTGMQKEDVPITDHNALAVELECFVAAVAGNEVEGSATGEHGFAAVEIAEQIVSHINTHNERHGCKPLAPKLI